MNTTQNTTQNTEQEWTDQCRELIEAIVDHPNFTEGSRKVVCDNFTEFLNCDPLSATRTMASADMVSDSIEYISYLGDDGNKVDTDVTRLLGGKQKEQFLELSALLGDLAYLRVESAEDQG